MSFLLFLLALLVGIYGVVRFVRGDVLVGIILVVVACLIGPGGYSILQ